ncbi:MAG: ATP-binding protein [Actinomycetota bacterium]
MPDEETRDTDNETPGVTPGPAAAPLLLGETPEEAERSWWQVIAPTSRLEGKTRLRPLTLVLAILFVLTAIALFSLTNLAVLRNYLEGETIFWVMRIGLAVMVASLIIYLIVREMVNLRYADRIVAQMSEANRRLRLLLAAGQEMGSTLDLPEILEKMLSYTFTVTGADMGAVYLRDKSADNLVLGLVKGVDQDKVIFKQFPMGTGLVGETALDLELRVFDSTESLDERDNVFFGAAEPASQVLVPLVARGKFVGMLVTGTREPHKHSEDETRMLEGFAELSSLAITNAELYRIARKSLDALARERGITGSVLEQMVAAVMTCDSKGRISIFNREAQRLTGYSFGERTQVMLRPETSLDENPLGPLEHGMLEALEGTGAVSEGEAVVLKKDNTLLPIAYRVYPLMDGPEVVGAAAVFMESRQEPSVAADRPGVDYQVFLRSLGARIERLYTHPLAKVLERTRGMDPEEWSTGRQDIIRMLEAGSAALLGLLEDVELYLSCTATREWDAPGEHSIEEIAASAVEGALDSQEVRGVVVTVRLGGLPGVFGHRRMMKTALQEVIGNAALAASEGGKKVDVTGREEPGSVIVEVKDTGPGVSPEAREYMYMPFFTLREGRSGLGLSVTQRVMQVLGGRVSLADSDGGATFVLEFPRAPGAAPGDGEASEGERE